MQIQRDIILIKSNSNSSDKELRKLNALIYNIEVIPYWSSTVEIVDVNKLKIFRKKHLVEQVLRQPRAKAFQFTLFLN